MTKQDLKNSILQLAIQGKLVKQRADEGTAEELYQQIQAEKAQLIKDGKIKKTKALPEISKDEVPFEIPKNWKWVRLGNISSILSDGIHGTPKYDLNGKYYFINGNNLSNGKIIIHNNTKKITNEEFEKYKRLLNETTVLVSINGTIGNVGLYYQEKVILGKSACYFNLLGNILREYIMTVISTDYFVKYAFSNATGSTIKNVSLKTMKCFLLPLPPLTEQKRIVAKIEELMPYVEKYGKSYLKLEKLNKKFPEDMQKSILQYAIQGKLVEQCADEGTAEELYQQIQAEKAQLIKDGKIKKTKPLPEISKDEIPFAIPKNWKWVRLGNLITLQSGQDLTSDKYNQKSEGIPYLTGASNINNGKLLINRWTNYPKNFAISGDLLVTCKGTIGKTVILQLEKIHIARQIMAIRPYLININYINCFMQNYMNILKANAKSMIPGIERNDILKATFPLPPLAEQKRIVAAIEKALPYCKQLIK